MATLIVGVFRFSNSIHLIVVVFFFRLQIKKKKKYLPLFVIAKCLAIDKNDNSGRRVDDVTLLIKWLKKDKQTNTCLIVFFFLYNHNIWTSVQSAKCGKWCVCVCVHRNFKCKSKINSFTVDIKSIFCCFSCTASECGNAVQQGE